MKHASFSMILSHDGTKVRRLGLLAFVGVAVHRLNARTQDFPRGGPPPKKTLRCSFPETAETVSLALPLYP
jgi:hypothetical protein